MTMRRRLVRLEDMLPPPPPDEALRQKRWQNVVARFFRLVEQAKQEMCRGKHGIGLLLESQLYPNDSLKRLGQRFMIGALESPHHTSTILMGSSPRCLIQRESRQATSAPPG